MDIGNSKCLEKLGAIVSKIKIIAFVNVKSKYVCFFQTFTEYFDNFNLRNTFEKIYLKSN